MMTIFPNGLRIETKVFAGNAVIGKQGTVGIEWRTADVVTGTLGKFSYTSQYGTSFVKEETEPLGQRINQNDPEEPPDPTYETRLGSADDPQWQCQVQHYFGGFQAMPWSCQYATKDEQSVPERKEESVVLLNLKIDKTAPAIFDKSGKAGYAVNSMRNAALTSSTKKMSEDDDEPIIIKTSVPRETKLPEDLDYFNAEFGESNSRLNNKNGRTEELDAVEEILKTESDCSKFFGPNALAALEAFREQLINAPIKPLGGDTIGIRQETTTEIPFRYFDVNGKELKSPTNAAYRLFSYVSINSKGPYNNPASLNKMGTSNYSPMSLQSKIAQILHELAHIVFKDGKVLIEDDGENGLESGANTEEILKNQKCKEAIDAYMKNRKKNKNK